MNLIDEIPLAKPFILPGKNQAILMIHGFTSTPNVFRALADELSKSFGWEICVPLLPSHGLTADKLDTVRYQEWLEFCENEMRKLIQRFDKIHVVGLSMGGTLVAHLAMKFPVHVASITLLSGAMFVKGELSRMMLPAAHLLPKSILTRWMFAKGVGPSVDPASYLRYSAKGIIEFDSVCKYVRREFKSDKPCLAIYSTQDETIDPVSSQWFVSHSPNAKSKLVELTKSPHVLFLGPENEIIFSEVKKFLATI